MIIATRGENNPIGVDQWFELPDVIKALVTAQKAVKAHYNKLGDARLSFTLDGNLVGDIGEALAVEQFGLDLHYRNGEGVDGILGNRKVQVKATGTKRGPSFRHTRVDAEHLLFFEIDFENCRARVVYNGPEAAIRAELRPPWKNQKPVGFARIERLNRSVKEVDRLPRKQSK